MKNTFKLCLLSAILLSFLPTCKKEKPDTSSCYYCDNETYVDTLTEVDAMVVSFAHDPAINDKPSVTLGFTYSKIDLQNGTYTFSDSLLVPCPAIPEGFQLPGKHVKISGYTKSCNNLLSCYNCTYFFGRKFELTNIH